MPIPSGGGAIGRARDPVVLRGEFWAIFTSELAEAKRRNTGKKARARLALMKLNVRDLLNTIWQIHQIRTSTEPASGWSRPHQLARAAAFLRKYQIRSKSGFSDDDFDMLAVHESGKVSFGGLSARCYALLWQELALQHLSVLSKCCPGMLFGVPSLHIDGLFEGGVDEAAFAGRCSPADLIAVDEEFNKNPDFNFTDGVAAGTTESPTPVAVGTLTLDARNDDKAQLTPKVYLSGWPAMLGAVGLKNNKSDKNTLLSFNRRFDGPIPKVGRGKTPRVEKNKLLDWWSELEEKFQASDAALKDKVATVEEQYQHGRDETVVPGISGHVQKRRSTKK